MESEDLAGTYKLSERSYENEGYGKSKSHSKTVKEGYYRAVLHGVGLCTSKDDTVNDYERNVYTKGCVQIRSKSFHKHVADRNQ